MSGRILGAPQAQHSCRPGEKPEHYVTVNDPGDPLHGMTTVNVPAMRRYPAGTIWLCHCGQHWIGDADRTPGMVGGYVVWRKIRPVDPSSTRWRDRRRLRSLHRRAQAGVQ